MRCSKETLAGAQALILVNEMYSDNQNEAQQTHFQHRRCKLDTAPAASSVPPGTGRRLWTSSALCLLPM